MTLDYGSYGIFLILGNVKFISSTEGSEFRESTGVVWGLGLGIQGSGLRAFRPAFRVYLWPRRPTFLRSYIYIYTYI